jgi:hypothetical protein
VVSNIFLSLKEDSQSVTCEKLAFYSRKIYSFLDLCQKPFSVPSSRSKKEMLADYTKISLGTLLKNEKIVMRNSTFPANKIKKDITDDIKCQY